jgi:hypothetical protein
MADGGSNDLMMGPVWGFAVGMVSLGMLFLRDAIAFTLPQRNVSNNIELQE